MNACPFCSHALLRHIRHSHLYWFCPNCRQDIPTLLSPIPDALSDIPYLESGEGSAEESVGKGADRLAEERRK